jgi:hypothetical protein
MIVITPKLVQASCSYFITSTTRKDSRFSGEIVLKMEFFHNLTVTCMVAFGDSKHEPVKPLHRLLNVTTLVISAIRQMHNTRCYGLLLV